MPDPACLVQTSLQTAEHLASGKEKSLRGHLQTLCRVKWFREKGRKSQQRSRSNAASVPHKWAGAPEKRHELIQLLLSKDTSALGEEGA